MDKLDLMMLTNLEGIPGFDGDDVDPLPPTVLEPVISLGTQLDLDEDYVKVRQSLYYQQQMILVASQQQLEIAKNADSPKHMEVFSQLMNQWGIINDKLIKMHKEMKAIKDGGKDKPKAQTQTNIQNSTVYMTTAEMMEANSNEEE